MEDGDAGEQKGVKGGELVALDPVGFGCRCWRRWVVGSGAVWWRSPARCGPTLASVGEEIVGEKQKGEKEKEKSGSSAATKGFGFKCGDKGI